MNAVMQQLYLYPRDVLPHISKDTHKKMLIKTWKNKNLNCLSIRNHVVLHRIIQDKKI